MPLVDSLLSNKVCACIIALPSALLQAGFPLLPSTHLNESCMNLVPLKSPTLTFTRN